MQRRAGWLTSRRATTPRPLGRAHRRGPPRVRRRWGGERRDGSRARRRGGSRRLERLHRRVQLPGRDARRPALVHRVERPTERGRGCVPRTVDRRLELRLQRRSLPASAVDVRLPRPGGRRLPRRLVLRHRPRQQLRAAVLESGARTGLALTPPQRHFMCIACKRVQYLPREVVRIAPRIGRGVVEVQIEGRCESCM